MPDEIDRLEIVVEAEANKANRALSGMEKRLDRVADSLAKVMLLANKGFDMNKFFGTSMGEKKAEQLGKRMADELIKGFNLDRAGSEVKRQVRNLSNSIANGLYSGGKNKSYISDMDKLGDVIKKNGSVAESVSSDYKELYDTIRAIGKIRISPETAKSLGDDYKDRSGILKSKMSTGKGIELDSIYQELKGRFPDILPDVSNTEDQFYAINDAVREFISLRDQAFRKVNEDEAYEAVARSVEDLNAELRVAKAESDAFNGSLSEMKSLSESFKFDFSGLDNAKASLDSALSGGKKSNAPRVKRADLKYTETSLDDLYDKYSNVGKNIDVSGMGLSELESGLRKSEGAANRFNDSLEKKLSIEQPKVLGKAFESLVYDIQKATNQAEIFREAIDNLKGKVPEFTIDRGTTNKSSVEYTPQDVPVSQSSMNYDPEAMRMTFGEGAEQFKNWGDLMDEFDGSATKARNALNNFDSALNIDKVNTYEAQIRRLKRELSELATQGFKQGDSEYDDVARQLSRFTAEKKKYDKAIGTSKTEAFSSNISKIRDVMGGAIENVLKFKSAIKEAFLVPVRFGQKAINIFSKFGSKVSSVTKYAHNMAKAFATPISQLGRLKNALLGVQKQSSSGMSWGRMIGSSVLFSFVFQGISAIQRAIVEGSNNLVQYSNAYNQSISSMVSALTYLKNAWAAAFAPIVNVVAPYIQAFIDMIASALNAIGTFFAALTGKGFVVHAKKVVQNYGASLADVGSSGSKAGKGLDDANKSAKKLQKTILGFDQLNILNDPDTGSGSGGSGGGGSGGGGGGGLDLSPSDMFETVKVDGPLADFAKKLREAFLAEDWEGLGEILADGVNKGLQKLYDAINWNNVGPKITYFCNAFTTTFNSLVDNINWDLMGRTVGAGINTIVNTLNLLITGIDWVNLGRKFAEGINGIFYEVNWDNLGQLLGNKFMIVWNTLYGVVTNLDYATIGQSFANAVNGIFSTVNFGTIGLTLSTGLNGLATILQNFTSTVDWDAIAVNFYTGINNFIHNTDWATLATTLSNFVMSLLGTINTVVQNTDWNAIGVAIGEFLGNIDWIGILTTVGDIIWTAFSGMLSGLFDTGTGTVFVAFVGALALLKGVFGFVDLSAEILGWITKASDTFGGFGDLIKSGVVPKVSSGISLITGEGGLFSKIASSASKFVGKATPILTSIGTKVFSPQGLLIAGIAGGVALIVTHWDEIKEAASKVKDFVGEKWDQVKDWTSKKWSEINSSLSNTWNDLKSWASDKFSNIKKTVSDAWEGAKEKTSSLWSSAKETAGNIWEGMKSTASNVFGSIGRKVKETWSGTEADTSKSWSNSKRQVDSSITGIDSSVKSKMSSVKSIVSSTMNQVGDIFNSKWRSISSTSTSAIGQMQTSVSQKMNSMRSGISSSMSSIINSYRSSWNSMVSVTRSSMNSVVSVFSTFPSKVNQSMSSLYTVGRNAATYFKNGLMSVYIPAPHLNVSSYTRHKVGDTSFSTPNFRVRWYEKGGFPNMGELFVANERGPELVGRMGNRNVVANNNQIISGIKQGVMDAMMEVLMATGGLGGNGGNQNPVFYIEVKTENDEVLARAVKRGNEKLDYRTNPSPAY